MLLGDISNVHRVASKPKPNGSVLCNTHQGLCDKQWEDLVATSDPQKRYCLSCANSVQLVKTYTQLTALRNSGLCVAYGGKLQSDNYSTGRSSMADKIEKEISKESLGFGFSVYLLVVVIVATIGGKIGGAVAGVLGAFAGALGGAALIFAIRYGIGKVMETRKK